MGTGNVNTQGVQSPHGLVHVDRFLTDFSIKYSNPEFIADLVCPPIDVKSRTDVYPIYGRESFTVEDDTVAARAAIKQTDAYSISEWGTYICKKHGLKDRVEYSERENADQPLDPDLDVTRGLIDKIMLHKEVRVATLLTTAANFTPVATIAGSDYTGAINILSDLGATYQWNNASFDSASKTTMIKRVIDACKTAIRKRIGMYPNKIIIPGPIAQIMASDPTFVDYIKYTHAELGSDGDLPKKLWNMDVVTPLSIKNSAERGATFTSADVWGNNIVLMYSAPNPRTPRTFTTALAFRYKPFRVLKEAHIVDEFDEIAVSEWRDERIVSGECAFIIQNPIG